MTVSHRAHYRVPPPTDREARKLLVNPGTSDEESCVFYERVEIGRYREGDEYGPGLLLLPDPTVSSRHCVITQTLDGRCFIRDMSRNGTRVDGRRLIPNLEMEVLPGQVISVGSEHSFVISGETSGSGPRQVPRCRSGTVAVSLPVMVTVLVGDIRDYTGLVQRAGSKELHESVGRVFERLAAEVERQRGIVKEYQGDAIVSFWEEPAGGKQAPGANHAVSACAAALELDRLAAELAQDRLVWALQDFPLRMDWALATGPVMLGRVGDGSREGLSMIGEPPVLAFRLEKFAGDESGRILTSAATKARASEAFDFKDLGEMQAKGFSRPDRVFALLGRKS